VAGQIAEHNVTAMHNFTTERRGADLFIQSSLFLKLSGLRVIFGDACDGANDDDGVGDASSPPLLERRHPLPPPLLSRQMSWSQLIRTRRRQLKAAPQ